MSPEVAAHPMKLEHQVQAKDKQYDKEIVVTEHDRPPMLFAVAVSQHRHRTFSRFVPKCLSACLYSLANLLLAPVHYVPEVDTRLPHLLVGGVNRIKTLVCHPFPSFFTRFGSEKYA